ncbi:transport energizing protein, ExbD/TolR family [Bacteriovorax sp. BSW11_IV]|uniref:ExbD/TolR family protein n=1 Tax=Bacteriovorax sp. BSW11_IV TaxID=1353529 RepID=UPI00038A19BD|nr:biopolymer transporter ExbD [Bacteriovorax sp. BSW11_IV]EQC48324.1 transport energizing protein, ExbD/TolR family [Bacteriovorax sp. BSW11_IV]
MYQTPSRRTQRKEVTKPNLIPILDAVFIFIFFLLMSANFIKVFEIPSDVPIISDREPPKTDKKPLALTLKIYQSSISIYTGVPGRNVRSFQKLADGNYDLEGLKSYLIGLKKSNLDEDTAILEPVVDLSYEDIIKIMDAIRMLRNTDPDIYVKDRQGMDVKLKTLFGKIIFGNIQS